MKTKLMLIARRSAAYLLDSLLLFLILAPLAFLVEALLGLRPQTADEVWMAAILSFSVPAWTYFVVSDASRRGATVGKRLLGVRVSDLDAAGPLTWTRALARTAVKLLPWELAHVFGFALADRVGEGLLAAGLIGANVLIVLYLAVFVLTAGHRSVHDYVAGTQVVRAPQGAPP